MCLEASAWVEGLLPFHLRMLEVASWGLPETGRGASLGGAVRSAARVAGGGLRRGSVRNLTSDIDSSDLQ